MPLSDRIGTVRFLRGDAAAAEQKYVRLVPQDFFSREAPQETDAEFQQLGVIAVIAIAVQGDPIPGERHFTAEAGGHRHSQELVQQIKNLNRGIYLDDTLTETVPTNFCIGVAGYPEKHYEAPNFTRDIEYLKQKVEAGADYIVTQMFFDNQKYFSFVEKCRAQGITVPIIPGLKPISTPKHIETLPRSFSIDIPEDLEYAIRHSRTPQEAKQVGIEWCIQQSRELLAGGVPAIHYYTMGKSDNVKEIVKQVF